MASQREAVSRSMATCNCYVDDMSVTMQGRKDFEKPMSRALF